MTLNPKTFRVSLEYSRYFDVMYMSTKLHHVTFQKTVFLNLDLPYGFNVKLCRVLPCCVMKVKFTYHICERLSPVILFQTILLMLKIRYEGDANYCHVIDYRRGLDW
jgi:hypothetical protein